MRKSIEEITIAFNDMIAEPSAEKYIRILEYISETDKYDPTAADDHEMSEYCNREEYDKVFKIYNNTYPNLLLCPKAHFILSATYEDTDREKDYLKEFKIAGKLLDIIYSSGDGSKEHPYIVSRVSDAYDIVRWKMQKPKSQTLIPGPKMIDTIYCEDGSKYCFDVTTPYDHIRKTNE